MLTELHIENFAIIDQIQLQFEDGLIIFTGETGAGKSIIMDALNTLLGSRADSTFIRSGATGALIEATFKIPASTRTAIHAVLDREALLDHPDFVTLGREIRRDSRNVVRINGRMSNVGTLRELGEQLVDIHGQSEHLSLLRVHEHLRLLDRFADLQSVAADYKNTYRHITKIRKELKELRQNEKQAAQRADMLEYQINEISAANLEIGQEPKLIEERNRLANAEKLATQSQKALVLLDENTPDELSISDRFGEVLQALAQLAQADPAQAELHTRATATFEEITDISHTLHTYLENIEFNPRRLDRVEERIDLLNTLKRKYGDTIADILAHGEAAQKELDAITHANERMEELQAEESKQLTELGKRAARLSQKRHAAAELLKNSIEQELVDLRMAGARFEVDFRVDPDPYGLPMPDGTRAAFSADGHERVEFLIETNPGEGFKPLVKVASGGETSRLMLALKNVLARADHIPTLVFDEIDQGIGGRVGTIVGQKLSLLAQAHQVLCITHLPQLAAYGQQHFQVQKQIDTGRTITQVAVIAGADRVRELAQMLGEISPSTLQSAAEILQAAQQKYPSGE